MLEVGKIGHQQMSALRHRNALPNYRYACFRRTDNCRSTTAKTTQENMLELHNALGNCGKIL